MKQGKAMPGSACLLCEPEWFDGAREQVPAAVLCAEHEGHALGKLLVEAENKNRGKGSSTGANRGNGEKAMSMKTEQIERIVSHLQNNGYGWIAKEDCRKIVLMVHSLLVVAEV